MKNRFYSLMILVILLFMTSCSSNYGLDRNDPVTISLWHNYGGQMKNIMDELVDEFNRTVGKEKGIVINITSISGSATLHEKLSMAANGDPGAPELPDITTAYPKTALILANKGLLADFNTYFTEKELSNYVPDFLNEGIIKDDKLYVFPVAKSTEVLFVNKTIFDRFLKDTGITMESLGTFEGIVHAADEYYKWSGGKMFFMPDSLFNLAQIGFEQLGDQFIVNERLNLTSDSFNKIWNFYYKSALKGSFAVFDGYSSDLAKTGEIICSLGSTAGILFYPSTVTYLDNTTEEIDYEILPYPVFDGGKKVAIQRGGGMCVIKSSKQKEYGATLFIKWLTSPEINLKFTLSTGYLPVTNEAFSKIITGEFDNIQDSKIKRLLSTIITMHKEYEFYIPPLFDDFDNLGDTFEEKMKSAVMESKQGISNKNITIEEFINNYY